jgi:hypothetical protein
MWEASILAVHCQVLRKDSRLYMERLANIIQLADL